MAKNEKKKKEKTSFSRRVKLALKDPLVALCLLIVVLIFVACVVVYNTETKTGSGIVTKFDTFWFMCVAVFANYFEFVCESIPGRAAGWTMLMAGLVLFTCITAKIASWFVDVQMKNDKGLKKLNTMQGHFVLCGWRPGFENILENVLISNPDISTDMIVLINDAVDQMVQLRSQKKYKDLNYISGDFTDEAVLNRGFIKTASRALIISDKSKKYSNLEIDSRTVLAVLTIENMNRGIYVSAELISEKFEKHLKMAHCDEIILTQEYERNLLATASSGLGYSNVIRSLISDDADSGVLIADIPDEFIGKTYKELKDHFWAARDTNGILVGLLLNSGNFHLRRKEAIREAQKNPNMNDIIGGLKKVKTLVSNEPLFTPANDYIVPKNSKAIYVNGKK
ncbi:MAG: NAD-binding protein [Treponema sp.]|nr:NAD-binding protein [Treponema sp.]